MKWISIQDKTPPNYRNILYYDSRDGNMHVGHFVWEQTPVKYVTHWMPLPNNPNDESPSPSDHIADGKIEADCIAVGFAEWIVKRAMFDSSLGVWYNYSKLILDLGRNATTKEFLEAYKQSPEFKALNIGEGKIDWDAMALEIRKRVLHYRDDIIQFKKWFSEFKALNIGEQPEEKDAIPFEQFYEWINKEERSEFEIFSWFRTRPEFK